MSSSSSRLASGPFFLCVGDTQRFCYLHAPDGAPRGSVLVVQPFAEELNKSRAAVADGARALAATGLAVLLIDLVGCGDSDGDFEDASWDGWLDDLAVAWRWLAARASGERWLWGVRFGALLAQRFATTRADPRADGLLLWQPVVNGAQHLGQFLRLKTIGGLIRDAAMDAAPTPRAALAAGEVVEVAGYRLAPALADAMERAMLRAEDDTPSRVRWLEVSTRDGAAPSPVATRTTDAWRAAGRDVRADVVVGSPFWQTAEVERCPALVAATVAALAS